MVPRPGDWASGGGRSGLAALSGTALASEAMELDVDDASNQNFVAATGDDNNICSREESVEDNCTSQVILFASVVLTNDDYGLGHLVVLPDPYTAALVTFEAVELPALTFFASRSVVRTGRPTEVDPPICFKCLCWNLITLFSLCNRDG
jgi:hypothetical protein